MAINSWFGSLDTWLDIGLVLLVVLCLMWLIDRIGERKGPT